MAQRAGVVEWHAREVIAEISGRVVRGMDRAASNAADRARGYAPKRTGLLAGEITHKVEVRRGEVIGFVGVKRGKAFYAHMVERGTSSHKIRRKTKRALANRERIFGREVTHPGTRAQPFLRPAVFNHPDEIVRDLAAG